MSTPLMKQYHAIKAQHPDIILLFQVGDFYELFFDDAKVASACLGIALTQRGAHNGEPIPLCGVPVHAIDLYCAKLIKAGYRVAFCDQLTEPQPGKVVERGVTQIITPGTITQDSLLDAKKSNYIVTIVQHENMIGFCAVELLTGQLSYTTLPAGDLFVLESELARFAPDEVIIPDNSSLEKLLIKEGYYIVREKQEIIDLTAWRAERDVNNLSSAAEKAVSLWYQYMTRTNNHAVSMCRDVRSYHTNDFLVLDAVTQRNLELVVNTHDGTSSGTLFSVLDDACTAMGSRVIKKWIIRPLRDMQAIETRLHVVSFLKDNIIVREQFEQILRAIGDIERVVGRVAVRRAHLVEYQKILFFLEQLPILHALCTSLGDYTGTFSNDSLISLQTLLQTALNNDATKPWRIKAGHSTELDRLRMLVETGSQSVIALEKAEQQKTGINSLKIRYNRSYGYGIEITNTHAHLVPAHYTRLQTLTNRERFTTQELRDLEYDLNHAQNSLEAIEAELFAALCAHVETYIPVLRKTVHLLAQIDAYIGLARVAYARKYVRPVFSQTHDIIINQGRHPVVEALQTERFVANDTMLIDEQQLWLITGPNMGGKSTYMRQVALIILMAHMGSFVPAKAAQIPIVDRIFTRIGAADNVAQGKSTFLVEMEETALICRQATKNSLIILDEVGRGTSTYDGLAIAQAVVEYLYEKVKARCLFATHYHELVALAHQRPGIVAYHAASKQTDTGVVLLHTIIPGEAEGSFGIEVARRAQIPSEILVRAQELMAQFSSQTFTPARTATLRRHPDTSTSSVLKTGLSAEAIRAERPDERRSDSGSSPITQVLKTINYDELSPKQAFDILWKCKELL